MAMLAAIGTDAWAWLRDTASVGGVAGAVYAGVQQTVRKLGERPLLEWRQTSAIYNIGGTDEYKVIGVNLTVYNRSPAQLEFRGLKVIDPPNFEIPTYNDRRYGNFFGVWTLLEPYAPSAPSFPYANGGFDLGRAPLPPLTVEAILASRGALLWSTRRRFKIPGSFS